MSDKELSKKGRGSFHQIVDNNKKVVVVKWIDNKAVLLCSSFVDSYPLGSIKRHIKNKRVAGSVPVSYTHLDVYKRQT